MLTGKLTPSALKQMQPGTIFAVGTAQVPESNWRMVDWVACRGGIHDWAIYSAPFGMEKPHRIRTNGDKLSRDTAAKLVPCDAEALGMYRE